MPPWILCWRVLRRPPRISGKSVNSSTDLTATPASLRAACVPPVESISTSWRSSVLASSTSPLLSDTPSSARAIFMLPEAIAILSPIDARNAPADRTEHFVGNGLSQARNVIYTDDGFAGAAPQDDLVTDLGVRNVGQIDHRQVHAYRTDDRHAT